ncbi:hypothetical protein CTEN210_05673 [Chaetoceros tenuissimus]|uniref:Integrase catalytic domain-containing protein n=1 Tax=Chaetoceros tenuissimus TaxID=426638 RepID=A0AAD3CNE7_9STRA|nr:hypothetical protein CTEN210_05673 [Chaetoceros tenuissimus]
MLFLTVNFVNEIKQVTQYGHLPPRNVTMQPWHTVAVDLIGPWKMKIQGVDVEFRALTIVDNDTNLLKAVLIENTRAQHIADLFENTWLSRYPRPVKCIHDKGTEFTGSEFQQMLQRFHIRPSQITTKNPQGNSICERIHQTMLNQIRSLIRQNPPNDINQANHVIDILLANTVYALRTSLHSSLNASPGALAFQRDMILNIPFIADLNNIRNRRQEIVNRSNDRENANRLDYNYQVGDWILIRSDAHQVVQKLEERWFGPFQITQVHVNGNVTIRLRAALPSGCPLTEIPAESFLGFGGTATIHEKVTLQQVILPEFSRSLQIESFDAVVMDGRSNYDIILGRDFLQKIGLILDFKNLQIKWMNMEISMKPATYWNTLENVQIAFAEYTDEADEEPNDGYAAAILPSKYDDVSPDVIAAKQTHLDKEKQQDLKKVLHQFPTLFNGKLKQFKGEEVHLTLKKDAKPVQSRPYKVPFLHRQVFKNDFDRLVEQGVMKKAPRSEWVAPTFIIPKKDGHVCWVSDFRELNKNLIRKQYTLPRIHDIFERRNGYKYFTKLDITQYYTFKLDKASSMLCTIATPFGLYRYLCLPMGILESPDIAQEIMERLLANCDCEVYIDDIGIGLIARC